MGIKKGGKMGPILSSVTIGVCIALLIFVVILRMTNSKLKAQKEEILTNTNQKVTNLEEEISRLGLEVANSKKIISELKQKLVYLNNRNNAILKCIPICIMDINPETERIEAINGYGFKMLGINEDITDENKEKIRGMLPNSYRKFFRKGEKEGEGFLITLDGRELPVFVYSSNITTEDGTKLFIVSCIDATKEMLTRKELNETLINLNVVLNTLSHDIFNVSGGIVLLLETYLSDSQQDIELIKAARYQLEHLSLLLHSILELQKCNSDDAEALEKDVFIVEIITEAMGIFGASLEKRIVPVVRAEDNIPIKVKVGPLERILHNLIGNAIKFSPDGGRVTITGSIKTFEGEENRLVFSVKDEGKGMTQDEMHNIFKAYTQCGHTNGHGLGLNIIAHFVKILGGDITVNSELGKGSEFVLSVPYKMPSETNRSRSEDVFARINNGLTVVIADDNETSLAVLKKQLEKVGVSKILTATNGQEVLKMLEVHNLSDNGLKPIDIVFTDIDMPPGMGGIELAKIIKGRFLNLPIIATTGYSDLGENEGLFNDVVPKGPIGFVRLPRILRGLFQ